MSIDNKKINIVSDTNFNNNKIVNAKIDANENDITGVMSIREFVVTKGIFNKYKKDYYAGGDVLDIAAMISGENISSGDINLNSYSAYFDGYTLTNTHYSFSNGDIILDNIQEGGCSRAVLLNNAGLVFKHCGISAPKCESGNSIFELNNSQLSFFNSFISADFTERKSFFNIGANSSLELNNVEAELNCKQGLQDSNFGFDFIEVTGDNSNILVKNCQKLRMANDEANTDDDIEYNLIKTAEEKIVTINMFNNVIWMHGKGYEINKKILNVNLDNIDCHISNNDLQGNLYCRYESNNTITAKFEESGGEPVTFNDGDEVYDLYLTTEPMEESRGFTINDMWDFLEAVDVDQNDMQQAYREFKFEWHTIDDQSGFILNYDPEETYTTSDLISLTDLETNYSIHAEDENPEDWEDENWLGVYLQPNGSKFRIENTFTLEAANTFWQQVENGNASEIQASIYSFNNNSFNSEEGGYPNFFTNNSNSISTNRLVLNGRIYEDISISVSQTDYWQHAEVIQDTITGITGDIIINENTYFSQVTLDRCINYFKYDGSDWYLGDPDEGETPTLVNLNDYGIDVSQATFDTDSSFEIYSEYLNDKSSFTVSRMITIHSVFLNGILQLKKDYVVNNHTITFNDYTLKSSDSISII